VSTRVIALANQKGGVGKTTTAVNLAACIAELGRPVLLVDLDPQCNATSGVGVEPEDGGSVYAALLGGGEMTALIKKTHCANLDVVPSELDLAGAEVDVARADRYLHRFRDAVAPVRESGGYDFVLVDCPPSLGILTMNGLAASDSVVIPMQCEYYALEGLSVISRLVDEVKETGANPGIELEGILMTMYDARTNLAGQVVAEVRAHFGDKVYRTVIPRNVRLSEAPSYGIPVIEYAGSCAGSYAYRQLAVEVLERIEARRAYAAAAAVPGDGSPRPPVEPGTTE
jgi:chromosome partitioning protein